MNPGDIKYWITQFTTRTGAKYRFESVDCPYIENTAEYAFISGYGFLMRDGEERRKWQKAANIKFELSHAQRFFFAVDGSRQQAEPKWDFTPEGGMNIPIGELTFDAPIE